MRARSTNVFEDPEINPNYLSDPMDVRVHLGGMRLLRRMLGTPELAPLSSRPRRCPARTCRPMTSCWISPRRNGSTTYHLIGTARMGPETDPSAVVDDRLLVHGMQGLRVVDASIMPSMPSANTYATTLMIAEKAADFMRAA